MNEMKNEKNKKKRSSTRPCSLSPNSSCGLFSKAIMNRRRSILKKRDGDVTTRTRPSKCVSFSIDTRGGSDESTRQQISQTCQPDTASNDHEPPSKVPCPHCSRMFTRRGLGRHIVLKHEIRSEPSLPVSPPSNPLNTIMETLERVRVFRIIPKCVRTIVSDALSQTLLAVASTNDLHSWLSLMEFAPTVLRMPDRRHNRVSPPAFIRANLRAFLAGERFRGDPRSAVTKDKPSRNETSEAGTARRATIKLNEGDVSGAARLLCSMDSFDDGPHVVASLRDKHPSAPEDLVWPTPPTRCIEICTSRNDVLVAVKSFPKSSAAGLDLLRPRHLRDLIDPSLGESAARLADAIAQVIDILRFGNPPEELRTLIFGARLFAFRKPNGSIRPIACSSTLRRIAAKIACRDCRDEIANALGPHQLGFAKPGGLEAGIHATRSFLSTRVAGTVAVKLDFKNAFNTVRRDHMLTMVKESAPEMFRLVQLAYQSPSHLVFDKELIASATGIQQGDPLGPALFCLAIKPLVDSLRSPLNVWYLDDCLLAGDPQEVAEDVQRVLDFHSASGLELNPVKCEVLPLHIRTADFEAVVDRFRRLLPDCRLTSEDELELLGSPIFPGGYSAALARRADRLWTMTQRLSLIGAHRGMYLLRASLSAPKIVHLLRGCDMSDEREALQQFNDITLETLSSLLNLELTPLAKKQSLLPVVHGGLGFQDAAALAEPAVLSAMHHTADMVRSLLPEDAWIHFLSSRKSALDKYISKYGQPPENPTIQRAWMIGHISRTSQSLVAAAANDSERARLAAIMRPWAGAWLHALPSHTIGTLLDDQTVRIATALRLGVQIVEAHTCPCGEPVGIFGHHGLSCVRSSGRASRHAAINDTVARALRSAGMPCVREPLGLLRDDGRRPDGMTLVAFERGMPLVWDATVTDTLAPSVVSHGATQPGYAVRLAEQNKFRKYSQLQRTHQFSPIAFETLGGPGPLTSNLLSKISHRLEAVTGDARAGTFFQQRLSIDIQRGNAASVLGTMATWAHPRLVGPI